MEVPETLPRDDRDLAHILPTSRHHTSKVVTLTSDLVVSSCHNLANMHPHLHTKDNVGESSRYGLQIKKGPWFNDSTFPRLRGDHDRSRRMPG